MSDKPNITIPVDLTNPGQFFACCGLLELADRLWSKPGEEPSVFGWFEGDGFHLDCGHSLHELLKVIASLSVANTMTSEQRTRLDALSSMSKKQRESIEGAEDEKKVLEALRRELPIVLSGSLQLCIDWFTDDFAGGARFKTWAGQQSVLDIAQAMHKATSQIGFDATCNLWIPMRDMDGLPFNFDSDLGAQGSGIDVGFVFDALSGSEATRISTACRPAVELLAFVGLQRFRPCEIPGDNRFVYRAWGQPLMPAAASAVACGAIHIRNQRRYEFKLLYRTKYLKSFLPAIPHQGDQDE